MNGRAGRVVLVLMLLPLVTSTASAKPHPTWDPKTMFPCDYPLPIAVEQLPVKKPHFRIYITFDIGTLTMVPNIPCGNENPQEFMKKNWKKYVAYSHEALQWLEDHKLGRKVRQEWAISLDWWGKEFWPRGAKSPEQTFRAKATKPRPKAHPTRATAQKPGKKTNIAPTANVKPKSSRMTRATAKPPKTNPTARRHR